MLITDKPDLTGSTIRSSITIAHPGTLLPALRQLFGEPGRMTARPSPIGTQQIASSTQAAFEAVVLTRLPGHFRKADNSAMYYCRRMASIALQTGRLIREDPFERIYVLPAPA